jgi:hypothetical protein
MNARRPSFFSLLKFLHRNKFCDFCQVRGQIVGFPRMIGVEWQISYEGMGCGVLPNVQVFAGDGIYYGLNPGHF